MKPLNSSERTNAIWKFSLFYAVTVIFAVLGFVFLLYVPNNALKTENTNLNLAMNEQKKLVVLIDSMGKQLKGLENLDASFNQMTNEFDQAQGLRRMNEYEDHIQTIVYETKKDSSALIYPPNKRMAAGIISSLDAFLTYRNTIGLLRQTIKEKGINMEQIEALNNKLKDTEQQLETYKIILASKPADAGGGGGGKANNKEVEKLQLQLKDCQDQLKLAQASKPGEAAPAVDVTPFQTRIAELEAKLAMAKGYSDESKAESRITNCSQRKGLYQSALVVFKEYQNSNLESIKKEATQKVTDITAKLKKPPVGCE
jgi:DNA-dependent RNA polymerase auxiliary subunit epsilon